MIIDQKRSFSKSRFNLSKMIWQKKSYTMKMKKSLFDNIFLTIWLKGKWKADKKDLTSSWPLFAASSIQFRYTKSVSVFFLSSDFKKMLKIFITRCKRYLMNAVATKKPQEDCKTIVRSTGCCFFIMQENKTTSNLQRMGWLKSTTDNKSNL